MCLPHKYGCSPLQLLGVIVTSAMWTQKHLVQIRCCRTADHNTHCQCSKAKQKLCHKYLQYVTITAQNGKKILCFLRLFCRHSQIEISALTVIHSCSRLLMMMIIVFSPPVFLAAGPCLLSGLHAFCCTELCHRARAGGRAGRRNPEAVGADAGGEPWGQAAPAGTNTLLALSLTARKIYGKVWKVWNN